MLVNHMLITTGMCLHERTNGKINQKKVAMEQMCFATFSIKEKPDSLNNTWEVIMD